MDVLVTGGTGFIGTNLCRALDDRDHDVTAMTRNPTGAGLPAGVDRVRGDVTDPETLTEAVPGHDAVVNLVALSPLRQPRGGNRMHDRVHREGTENVVSAAEAAGVDRIVQLSGIGADPDGPTAFLRAKGRAEAAVRRAELDHVILRPTVVYGEGGEFIPFVKSVAPPYVTPLPGGGKTRFQVLWIGDAVPLVADAVVGADHAGETYELGGPDRLTLAEIAQLIHRADGRPSTVIPVPMALARVGMTVGGYLPGFPFGPDQYRSLQLDLVTESNDLEAFGVDATDLMTLRSYLGVT